MSTSGSRKRRSSHTTFLEERIAAAQQRTRQKILDRCAPDVVQAPLVAPGIALQQRQNIPVALYLAQIMQNEKEQAAQAKRVIKQSHQSPHMQRQQPMRSATVGANAWRSPAQYSSGFMSPSTASVTSRSQISSALRSPESSVWNSQSHTPVRPPTLYSRWSLPANGASSSTKKKPISKGILDDDWVRRLRKTIDEITSRAPSIDEIQEMPLFKQLMAKESEIDEQIRKKREESEKVVIRDLEPDQLKMVEDAMVGEGVIVDAFNTQITKKDLRTLQGSSWLNDVVIAFYGQLCINRSDEGDGVYPKIHIFNTFFYEKLRTAGYNGVKRWTRKIKLFEKDIIIVPVHLGAHWTCAAINLAGKRFEYYDSMHGENVACLELLREYIKKESLDKRKEAISVDDWEFYIPSDIPAQNNSYDCGVFTCMFMEHLSRRAPFKFSQKQMPMLRNRIAYEILTAKLLPE